MSFRAAAAYRDVTRAPNSMIIADTYTQVNKTSTAPIDPYTALYTAIWLMYQTNPHVTTSKQIEATSAHGQTCLITSRVFGRYL